MALKNVVSFKYSNAEIAADAAEIVTLYTVPVGKTFLLREVMLWAADPNPDTTVALYIFKAAGTDFTTGAIARGTGALSIYLREVPASCHAIVQDANTDAREGFLAQRFHVLEAGDIIKLIAWPDATALVNTIMHMVYISGDET